MNLPTDAVKDAAGNSAVAGPIGTFTLNVCPPECPDLIGQMTNKFPAAILAGKRGHAVVRMTNQGMMPVAGPVTVNLFVSDDANFSFNDVQVATSTRNLKLKTGKSKNRAFNFVYPATLGGGNYFLVARIDASNNVAETKERNNFPATAAPINIAPAFVDLQGQVAAPTGGLTPGGVATSVVTVTNAGNVPLHKGVPITLSATTDQAGSGAVALTTVTKGFTIAPGKSKSVKVKFTVPNTLTPGAYFLQSNLDPQNTIPESDETNNVSFSSGFNIT